MIYVKIGDKQIPASVAGRTKDTNWDDRASKAITLEMTHAEANELFVDGLAWSIVEQQPDYEVEVKDEEGNVTGTEMVTPDPVEYDNSDYCVAGDITDHRDGTVTCKMGKLTDLEETLAMVYGGDM